MVVHLFPDDLNDNLEGLKENPLLFDFKSLDCTLLRKTDTVIYKFGKNHKILKYPNEHYYEAIKRNLENKPEFTLE